MAEDRYDVRPSYFVYGGMLFVPLTRDYLKTWGDSWWQSAPRELVHLYENEMRTPDRREVVVLQKVLADRVNGGYHDLENLVVTHVSDVAVRDLAHLVEVVETEAGPFVRMTGSDGTRVVLDRAQVQERHDPLLQRYGVPRDRSLDLQRAKSLPVPLSITA